MYVQELNTKWHQMPTIKAELSKGVMKVVRVADCFCQNSKLALCLLNIWTPPRCARICSTEEKNSQWTLLFNLVILTQIWTLSSCFGMTTIPVYHLVGLCNSKISSRFYICVSSSLTLLINGIRIFLEVHSLPSRWSLITPLLYTQTIK